MTDTSVRFTGCYVTKSKGKKEHPYIVILAGYTLVNGRRKRKQTHIGCFKTKREAEVERARQLAAIQTSAFVPPSDISTGEFLEYWLDEYVAKGNYKARTIETYGSVVRQHLIPTLGHIPLQELSERDIERYYSSRRIGKERVSEGTLRQHHAILHKALKVATTSMKLLPTNPAERAEGKPKRRRNSKVLRVWSEEEVNSILEAAEEMGIRQAAFYLMAMETGMRKGELCGLLWEDVVARFGAGEIVVRRQLIRTGKNWALGPTKSGRERFLPISDELVDKLTRWKEEQEILASTDGGYENSGLVFTNGHGGPLLMNNIGQREFRRLLQAAGVRQLRFHDIRHTNASRLLAAGEEVKLVSERLGHSSASITMDIYCHTSDAAHRALANRIWKNSKSKKTEDPVRNSIYSMRGGQNSIETIVSH